MKKVVIILIFILAFLGIGIFLALGWYNEETTRPNSDDSTKIAFEVKVGETAESVAKKLSDNNLISSADLFLFYVKRSDQSKKIKAGNFLIAKNLSFDQILEILNDPKEKVTKVFFPEGLRSDEIAEALENIFIKEDKPNFSKKEWISTPNSAAEKSESFTNGSCLVLFRRGVNESIVFTCAAKYSDTPIRALGYWPSRMAQSFFPLSGATTTTFDESSCSLLKLISGKVTSSIGTCSSQSPQSDGSFF
jgi:hypothetical protein